ncbi:MAG: epoxyqueuosine reductase [Bacillota bacterium]
MRHDIERLIVQFVAEYPEKVGTQTVWKKPLIAYAAAEDELFSSLKKIVSPTHALPGDFLPGAKTVIAYFLPFVDAIPESNVPGRECSRAWAVAYIETNKIIFDLNTYINKLLGDAGYRSVIIPATHNFDSDKLMSDWSHRHVAYIAGLGKFGLNNMLITDSGCCGRVGTIVTDLVIEPTERKDREFCLFKLNRKCARCVPRCVNGALRVNHYDRHKCYEMCLHNADVYSGIGLADVCGKCLVNVPCATSNPAKTFSEEI